MEIRSKIQKYWADGNIFLKVVLGLIGCWLLDW